MKSAPEVPIERVGKGKMREAIANTTDTPGTLNDVARANSYLSATAPRWKQTVRTQRRLGPVSGERGGSRARAAIATPSLHTRAAHLHANPLPPPRIGSHT